MRGRVDIPIGVAAGKMPLGFIALLCRPEEFVVKLADAAPAGTKFSRQKTGRK